MPQAVLLGTENRAKQERLAWLLEGLGLKVVTPAQQSVEAPEIEEDGLLLAHDKNNGNPIIRDLGNLSNLHFMILAKSGAGKSG